VTGRRRTVVPGPALAAEQLLSAAVRALGRMTVEHARGQDPPPPPDQGWPEAQRLAEAIARARAAGIGTRQLRRTGW
jgi:hypothetical protein